MADYSITFARSARKELEKLPSSTAQRIIARIEALMEVPKPSGAVKLAIRTFGEYGLAITA